jgi:hypothetical protein
MKHIKSTMAIGLLLSLVGCQSTSEEPIKVAETNQQVQGDGTYAEYQRIKDQYDEWLEKLQGAESLKYYSASNYKTLLKEWGSAVDIYEEIAADPAEVSKSTSVFSSTTNAEAFDKHLTRVKQSYQQLLKLKAVADDVLADAIAQKTYLDEIGAEKLYPSDYRNLVSKYSALFKEVEQGDLDDAQSRQVTFLNQAKELEQEVVLKRYVAPLIKELSALRGQEFDEVAAISYAKAEAEIMSAEQTIRANTRDLAVIKLAVAHSRFELEHVKSVALEVKKLASVEDDKFEPVVLDFESKLLMLSQAVDNSDYRDNALRSQAESILTGIDALQKELETARLSHSESVNQLGDDNRALKQALQEKESAIAQAEADNQNLSKQLEQTASHVESLEALIEMYKVQLQVASQQKAQSEEDKEPKDTEDTTASQPEEIAEQPESVVSGEKTVQQVSEPVAQLEANQDAG